MIFSSTITEVKSGSFSIITNTTAITSDFTNIIQTGVAPTENWTYQANWNVNIFSDLDQTKGNVYQIQFQWLGYGLIVFSIENEIGEFTPVHKIYYANKNTTPSVFFPSLPLYAMTDNGATTNDIIVKTASMSLFNQGQIDFSLGPRFGCSGNNENESINSRNGNFINMLSLKNNVHFQGTSNRSEVLILYVDLSTESGKAVVVQVFKNTVYDTSTSITWTDIDASSSCSSYMTDAVEITSGSEMITFSMAKVEKKSIMALPLHLFLDPGDVLCFACRAIGSTSTTSDLEASIHFVERQ